MPVNCLARWVPNICRVTLTINETILSICVAGQEFNVTIVSDGKKLIENCSKCTFLPQPPSQVRSKKVSHRTRSHLSSSCPFNLLMDSGNINHLPFPDCFFNTTIQLTEYIIKDWGRHLECGADLPTSVHANGCVGSAGGRADGIQVFDRKNNWGS